MKLIIQNNRIAGTATDDYTGPDEHIAAPADYNPAYMADYVAAAGVIALPATHARDIAKAARQAAVNAITVTTAAGHTYQGDETSQGRMARAIIALNTGLAPSVTWVLADNSVIQATAAELTEALVLAGQAQAAIWVIA
jgi:saccharopine dehydrogenase-like NADP-dependent oxidoreductase